MRTAPTSGKLRIRILVALGIFAALIAALLVPIAAEASGIELSGIVSGPSGKAIAGASVSVVTVDLGVPATIATTTSSSLGEYTFQSLGAGSDYSLYFGATSKTFPQYLGDTSDVGQAQIFTLATTGGAHTTINASLIASGTISGSVKSITHAALKGYTVRAFANGSDVTPVRSAVSSSSGAYSLTGLEPGFYQLEAIDTAASAPYGPVYSGGAGTLDAASAVQVIAGATKSYSFTLGKAGGISGVVTGETATVDQPLPDVTVIPYLMLGTSPSFSGSTTVGMTPVVTKADGSYSLSGLMPGYYTLDFVPGASTPHDTGDHPYGRTFLGSENFSSTVDTTKVHVLGGGVVSGMDQELEPQSSITVTVVDSVTSDPVSNIQITIDHENAPADQPNDSSQTGITDGSGQYTFNGLGQGYWEVTVGSNTGAGGTITTYQREVVNLSTELTIGNSFSEQVTATLKAVGGLQATATPTIDCCGGGPYVVADEIGVDPYVVSWTEGDVDPAKVTVQWYRNGVAIPGATQNQYLLQAEDAGQSITATLTAHDFAYGSGTASTDPLGPIPNGHLYAGSDGGLLGSSSVGGSLVFTPEGWSVAGVHETDVWQQSTDGGSTWPAMAVQPTNNKWSATAADIGSEVRVEVTGTVLGYDPVTFDTTPATIGQGFITLVKSPKITTTSTKWTVSSGTWSPNVGTTNFIWVVTDHATGIDSYPTGATLSRATYAGDYVAVRANRQPPGFFIDYSGLLTAQTGAAPTPTTTATITGIPQYNTLLHANVPTFEPPTTTVACQWQYKSGSQWKNESGATACTYTPVAGDIGRVLRVEMTSTLTGFKSTMITATESTAVTALSLSNTVVPAISGTTGTGDAVTVSNGTWSSVPSSFSYHWLYSPTGLAPFKAAPGSTNSSSYTIPQSLLNDGLEAQVTASLSGHSSATATSTVHTVVKGQLTELTAPKVTLSGTTLTASGATFSPAATSVQYSWYYYSSNDTTLNALNSNSATQSISAHLHDHIVVRANGVLSGYTTTPGLLVLAKKGDEVATGTLAISGHIVGAPVIAGGITWSVSGSTVTYQWQYQSGSTWKSISGATLQDYAPTGTYLGKTIRVLESASHPNYTTTTVTSSNSVVVTSGIAPTPGIGGAAPALTGTNQVGDTLTISPGTWNPTASTYTYTYQWQTSPNNTTWTNVTGATSTHFVVPLSAFTTPAYIGVVITASKSGYTPGTVRISTGGQATQGQVGLVKAPIVTVVGTTLKVSNGTWTNATSFAYDWETVTPIGAISTPVGSNTNSYTPVPGDAGKAIIVTVTAHNGASNYSDNHETVLARSGGPITAIPAITVTGTPSTGSTLTAAWTAFSVDSPTVTYQWYRSGKAITGATAHTYPPVDADVGKILSVVVTASKVGWTTEKFTAAATVTQSDATIFYSTNPVVSGSPTVDSVLTVTSAHWTESGVTSTYQWVRGAYVIPGATGTKYTLTAADLGADIYVLELGDKPYRPERESTSAPVTIGEGAALTPLATPIKISGTPAIGNVLKASMGAWNFPVTLTYEWQYATSVIASFNDIPGANASSYTPTAPQVAGGRIQVIVHAYRPGHPNASLTSTAVTIS